jgi:hypothetical protein
MLFLDLFFGLRNAKVKVGLGEWMALLRALSSDALEPSLNDLYTVGRALLIKHEAQFDTWDQVFAAVFRGGEFPKAELEEILDWLADPKLRHLSPEELAKLEALPLDELRRRFEERLREQKERHDGGNHYIGTGGTSPFGNSGANPAGMRVGGGGGKSAVQIAEERRYADLRGDRVLDTRSLSVALKKLRRLTRNFGEPELEVEESIDKTCKNAGELELVFRPPRKNEARVLLLMDVGGSMDPHARLVEQLFSAASTLNAWRKFEAFFFHNCPYETVFTKISTGEGFPTADLLRERPKETFLIIVGDADMAPSELTSRWGSLPYYKGAAYAPGLVWLHRLRSHFTRSIWLNPLAPKYWPGSYTIRTINLLYPMYPLTLEGLEEGVEHLLRRIPEPLPELPEEYRNQSY